MASFDIVSEANQHEVQNAFDQTVRELEQRFDFRGTGAALVRKDFGFEISANSEDRVNAAYDVLTEKFVRRKLSLKFLEKKDPLPAGGQNWRMAVNLKKGIEQENGKKLTALIREDKKLKVTATIQGDAVRVTGKKKDDLQEVIAMLNQQQFPLELSFTNYRD